MQSAYLIISKICQALRNMLEVACFSSEDAYTAFNGSADRVELCTDYDTGGTTPTLEDAERAQQALETLWNESTDTSAIWEKPTLFVMIRPRGGNFVYTKVEFERMKQDLTAFVKRNLAHGFVFGLLNEDGIVDIERNTQLVKLAAGLPCTFHRAIDQTPDPMAALQAIAVCGFMNVLSSGDTSTATKGIATLEKMVKQGNLLGLTVVPGGGVWSNNVTELKAQTGASWFHSSVRIDGQIRREEVRKLWEAVWRDHPKNKQWAQWYAFEMGID